ncbi:hypothetical protein DAI22_10g159200 [Oryza sativa Japonica Group]|nr:hypothetical protein DAI22_10g159200 [Oryza sativa Japonica Group]
MGRTPARDGVRPPRGIHGAAGTEWAACGVPRDAPELDGHPLLVGTDGARRAPSPCRVARSGGRPNKPAGGARRACTHSRHGGELLLLTRLLPSTAASAPLRPPTPSAPLGSGGCRVGGRRLLLAGAARFDSEGEETSREHCSGDVTPLPLPVTSEESYTGICCSSSCVTLIRTPAYQLMRPNLVRIFLFWAMR